MSHLGISVFNQNQSMARDIKEPLITHLKDFDKQSLESQKSPKRPNFSHLVLSVFHQNQSPSMAGGNNEPLITTTTTTNNNNKYERCASHAGDELKSFRACLRWMCIDAKNYLSWSSLLPWTVFIIFSVVVPALSHFVHSYSAPRKSFDSVVQLSLSAISALSFITLSWFVRRFGLRRVLFIDVLCRESEMVREGYVEELRKSFDLLLCFVLPCFLAECAYKIWWYCYCAGRIPFLRNHLARKVMACAFELWSWTYRTSTFFLLCVLFHLVCHLQILRLQDFASTFQDDETDVALILKEHLRIRRKLRVISHRFRVFIVVCLVIVTVSLFATLLVTTRSHAEVNFFTSGELALCALVLATGLLVCLRSAAKITHKAQAITSLAAKWHICATIEYFETDTEGGNLYDSDDNIPIEDVIKDTHLTIPHVNSLSFQQRQALVTYMENNRAGITVFGCMMDRAWLHAVFGVEFALVLWLLGKTVGI